MSPFSFESIMIRRKDLAALLLWNHVVVWLYVLCVSSLNEYPIGLHKMGMVVAFLDHNRN